MNPANMVQGAVQKHTEEQVFRAYSPQKGQEYAKGRTGYAPIIYETVVDYHKSGGGHLDTILDVGCGPGTVVRRLAQDFDHAIGVDPSIGMVQAANTLGGLTKILEPIKYILSRAETLDGIPPESVDIVTVAAAAHWFNLAEFWPRAAEVLRPGGTVAVWSGGPKIPHDSNPNAEALLELFRNFAEDGLGPHMSRGNILGKERYADLLLPWNMKPAVNEFDLASFHKRNWVPIGESTQDDELEVPLENLTIDQLVKAAETMSPVTRWREAHPELAGTDHDLIKVMRRKMEVILRNGKDQTGPLSLALATPGVLLLFRKNAA